MPPTFREIDIHLPFLRFAARCWGNPKGIPVIGLHGWLDNAASFDHLAPLLPEFYLIALDFHGHGFSDHLPPGMSYHLVDSVEFIFAIADQLELQEFSLIGHSMGASVATVMAGVFPERIRNLIMIEGLGPFSRQAEFASRALRSSIEGVRSLKTKNLPIYSDFESAVQVRYQLGGMKLSSVRTLVQRGIKVVENGVTWATDPRLRIMSRYYFTEEQVTNFLQNIRCPTLLIHANFVFQEQMDWQQKMRKRCQFVSNIQDILVDGQHHVHLDHPESVATIIREFLRNRV